MGIEIKEPSKVRLRCGGEVNVGVSDFKTWPVNIIDAPVQSYTKWREDGRFTMDGDHPLDIIEVIAPLKPAFCITEPGDYWTATGKIAKVDAVCGDISGTVEGCFSEVQHRPYGFIWKINGTRTTEVFPEEHIVAKVEYRQRPLTPDEAFKLRDAWVYRNKDGVSKRLTHVGNVSVRLHDCCTQRDELVSFELLSRNYSGVDGRPLSVREPVPFTG